MSLFAFRIDALPADVVALLLRFLSGFDLLPMSHVNRRFHRDLLAADGAIWSSRLPSRSFAGANCGFPALRPGTKSSKKWKAKYKKLLGELKVLSRSNPQERATLDKTPSWKQLYLTSSSVRFPGCKPGLVVERQSGGALQMWEGLHHAWNADAFSFDVWFALLPETATKLHGGILFAAQGTEWPGVKHGDDCQQFLYVDCRGDLYCSMGVEKTVVAPHLETHRWYHVAVSFERFAEDWWKATQCVYLDGELAHKTEVSVHPRWRFLNHAQLGSGVMDGDAPWSPSPEHRGWYGFNGVLDDFRFWNGAVTSAQVKLLFRGQEESVDTGERCCLWSVKRDDDRQFYGANIQRVQSTRPREQRCLQVQVMRDEL
jgi:hypothetical protein